MQFSPQGTCVVVLGQAQGILKARKYLMGLLPATLQFDRVSEQSIERSLLRSLEERLDLQICEKSKTNGPTTETAFLLRTYEANLHNAYLARREILNEEAVELIPNEYEFMRNFLE
jgi:hypothetical protein